MDVGGFWRQGVLEDGVCLRGGAVEGGSHVLYGMRNVDNGFYNPGSGTRCSVPPFLPSFLPFLVVQHRPPPLILFVFRESLC